MAMKSHSRTFYEIIPPNLPCRLYFDLEFSKVLNPHDDGEESYTIFKSLLKAQVQKTFGLTISDTVLGDNGTIYGNIVELDATNWKKFSRHIIVNLPGEYVFRDSKHVFTFVQYLYNVIKATDTGDELKDAIPNSEIAALSKLMYSKEVSKGVFQREPFIDLGVYTSYRNFRLILSAKFEDIGKRHFCLWSSKQKRAMRQSCISPNVFNASLVCFPALMNIDKIKILPGLQSDNLLFVKPIQNNRNSQAPLSPLNQSKYSNESDQSISGRIMYPNVVRYFETQVAITWPKDFDDNIAVRSSPSARVYSIRLYKTPNPKMTIAVSGNRYCLNIQRRHKKNNIFFDVDIENFCYTQKCFDETCKGYKSSSVGLPPEIFFSTKKERQ